MAKYIRIDTNEDYEWLIKVLDNWLNADPNSQALQINYVFIANWRKYLDNPVSAKEVSEAVPDKKVILTEADTKKTSPKPKKKRTTKSKRKQKPDVDPYKCPDHPTYGAKNRPRSDCATCWDLYKKFNALRYDQARREFNALQIKKANK